MAPERKYTLDGKEYATKAEYDQALQAMLKQMEQDREEWARRSAAAEVVADIARAAASELPAPKPPRKPTTRKPRE